MVVGLPHTPAAGVCKPPKGAIVKSYGAERLGKRLGKTGSGACKKLND